MTGKDGIFFNGIYNGDNNTLNENYGMLILTEYMISRKTGSHCIKES
jgi:hypothetical protein